MHRRTAATELDPAPTPRKAARPRSSGRMAGRYPGSSQNPLTHKQKGIICKVARRAFVQREPQRPTVEFELWRRKQQEAKVGHRSLTECTQADYLPLVAHFEGLAGEGGRQFEAAFRGLDEETRQARHLLDEALRARGLHVSYAEKICRDHNHGKSLDQANAKQLWNVKFTVEARKPLPVPEPQEADMPF